MKYIFFIISLVFLLYSCGGDALNEVQPATSEVEQANEKTIIVTDFHSNKFIGEERKLLDELDSMKFFNSLPNRIFIEIPEKNREELLSEKYFKFLPLFPHKKLSEAFIMTVSGELFTDKKFATMTNRSYIFERVNDALVLVNSFRGSIKELKFVNENSPLDMVLEFNSEKENAYFYCLYSWIKGKFQFSKCIGYSSDKGLTQVKFTDAQTEEFSPEIKEIIEQESFAF